MPHIEIKSESWLKAPTYALPGIWSGEVFNIKDMKLNKMDYTTQVLAVPEWTNLVHERIFLKTRSNQWNYVYRLLSSHNTNPTLHKSVEQGHAPIIASAALNICKYNAAKNQLNLCMGTWNGGAYYYKSWQNHALPMFNRTYPTVCWRARFSMQRLRKHRTQFTARPSLLSLAWLRIPMPVWSAASGDSTPSASWSNKLPVCAQSSCAWPSVTASLQTIKDR